MSPAQAEGVVAGKTGDRQRWAFFSGLDVGADGDPYLDRLRIIQTPWAGVYLHHIHRPDRDRDPHDHPWSFASLVLCGSYDETVWPDKHDRSRATARTRRRWSWASTSRRAAHLISSIEGPLWTLVITGPRRAEWGFWERPPGPRIGVVGNAQFVPWREYTARRWPDPRKGYRPFHADGCLARTQLEGEAPCTCGGLDMPLWKPGDGPGSTR